MTTSRSELPATLYTTATVRELDRIAIGQRHIAGLELMQRAGKAAFDLMRGYWPQARKIVVVCGMGNNGGDGYILAQLAHKAQMDVTIAQLGDSTKLKGDALAAAQQCHVLGLQAGAYSVKSIEQADVVVDAIFGTGLDRQPKAEWRTAIEDINRLAKATLSLDIPSGLNADTGRRMGVAIKADVTISFIGMKQGLLTADGPSCCGETCFSDLLVPADIFTEVVASAMRIDASLPSKFLFRRPADMHKGQCGHVLVVGGDYGYAGAVRMAAEAAMRVGAGLVTVATRPEHALSIPMSRPELMSCALNSAEDLNSLLEKATVIVIGPGMGQSDWACSLLAKVLETKQPLLVDADALNLLSLEPSFSTNRILTPHPAEAGRLLSSSTSVVQADRFAAARAIQSQYGGVCVLKGCGSLVIDCDQDISVCSAGNPGMATAGMGDVLSGVIAGLIGQGLQAADAARVGVCLHASAADHAAEQGERGLLASDLMDSLRMLANPN